MTTKDFWVVANILSYTTIEDSEEIEKLLEATNPRFNKEKFWTAVLDYKLQHNKK